MPTLFGLLGVGHSIPIMGSLYDQNRTTKEIVNLSIQRLEATFDLTTMEAIALESKVRDHLLLTVQGNDQWHSTMCLGGQWRYSFIH